MYLVKGSRPVRRRRTEMVEERGEERRLFWARWKEGGLKKGELEEGARRVLPLEADKEERWWEVDTALLINKWLFPLHIFQSLSLSLLLKNPLALFTHCTLIYCEIIYFPWRQKRKKGFHVFMFCQEEAWITIIYLI